MKNNLNPLDGILNSVEEGTLTSAQAESIFNNFIHYLQNRIENKEDGAISLEEINAEKMALLGQLPSLKESKLLGTYIDAYTLLYKYPPPRMDDPSDMHTMGRRSLNHARDELLSIITLNPTESLTPHSSNITNFVQALKRNNDGITYGSAMAEICRRQSGQHILGADVIEKANFLQKHLICTNYKRGIFSWIQAFSNRMDSLIKTEYVAKSSTFTEDTAKMKQAFCHDMAGLLLINIKENPGPYDAGYHPSAVLNHVACLPDVKRFELGHYVLSHPDLDLNITTNNSPLIDRLLMRLSHLKHNSRNTFPNIVKHEAKIFMEDYEILTQKGLSAKAVASYVSEMLSQNPDALGPHAAISGSVMLSVTDYLKINHDALKPLQSRLLKDGWPTLFSADEIDKIKYHRGGDRHFIEKTPDDLANAIHYSNSPSTSFDIIRTLKLATTGNIRSETARRELLTIFYMVSKSKNGHFSGNTAENIYITDFSVEKVRDTLSALGYIAESTPVRSKALIKAMLEGKLFEADRQESPVTQNNILAFIIENGLHQHLEAAASAGHLLSRPVRFHQSAVYFRPSNYQSGFNLSSQLTPNKVSKAYCDVTTFAVVGATLLDRSSKNNIPTSLHSTPRYAKVAIACLNLSDQKSLSPEQSRALITRPLLLNQVIKQTSLDIDLTQPFNILESHYTDGVTFPTNIAIGMSAYPVILTTGEGWRHWKSTSGWRKDERKVMGELKETLLNKHYEIMGSNLSSPLILDDGKEVANFDSMLTPGEAAYLKAKTLDSNYIDSLAESKPKRRFRI